MPRSVVPTTMQRGAQTEMLAQGVILRQRYQVLRLLTRSGMGRVYLAFDHHTSQQVVLKQLLPTLADEELAHWEIRLAAFQREIDLLRRTAHSALPCLLDQFTTSKDHHFFAMDYVNGETLQTVFEERRRRTGQPVPLTEVVGWSAQLTQVLSYLHQLPEPIVHLDIKPCNIIRRPDGKLVLIDFGAAACLTGVEKEGVISEVYTPEYASPEQHLSLPAGVRSDLFSLAATFYYLLTGQRPASVEARVAAQNQQARDPLLAPHDLCHQIPLAASEMLCQGLALAAAARPASVQHFHHALQQSLVPSGKIHSTENAVMIMPLSQVALAARHHAQVGRRSTQPVWLPAPAQGIAVAPAAGLVRRVGTIEIPFPDHAVTRLAKRSSFRRWRSWQRFAQQNWCRLRQHAQQHLWPLLIKYYRASFPLSRRGKAIGLLVTASLLGLGVLNIDGAIYNADASAALENTGHSPLLISPFYLLGRLSHWLLGWLNYPLALALGWTGWRQLQNEPIFCPPRRALGCLFIFGAFFCLWAVNDERAALPNGDYRLGLLHYAHFGQWLVLTAGNNISVLFLLLLLIGLEETFPQVIKPPLRALQQHLTDTLRDWLK